MVTIAAITMKFIINLIIHIHIIINLIIHTIQGNLDKIHFLINFFKDYFIQNY